MGVNFAKNPHLVLDEAKIIFAEWHKMKRKSLKLTRKELAEHLGVSYSQIEKYERGQYLPQDFYYYKELFNSLDAELKGRVRKKKFRPSLKVVQICKRTGETIKVWDSAIKAANHFGISQYTIRRACRTEGLGSCGYYWRYLEG